MFFNFRSSLDMSHTNETTKTTINEDLSQTTPQSLHPLNQNLSTSIEVNRVGSAYIAGITGSIG